MKQFSDNIDMVNSLDRVINDSKLINFYKKESKVIWETYKEQNSGAHLIEAYKASAAKGESIKSFLAYMIKLHLDSIGNKSNTYSKVSMEKHNKHISRIANNLAGVASLKFDQAFRYGCVTILGWDDTLTDIGFKYDELTDIDLFHYAIRYLFEYHDLLDEFQHKPLEQMTDQEVIEYRKGRYETCSLTQSLFTEEWIKEFFKDPQKKYEAWFNVIKESDVEDKVKVIEMLAKV